MTDVPWTPPVPGPEGPAAPGARRDPRPSAAGGGARPGGVPGANEAGTPGESGDGPGGGGVAVNGGRDMAGNAGGGAPGADPGAGAPRGCPRCGAPVEQGDGFCEGCGAPLRGQAGPVRTPVAPRAGSGPATRVCVECGFAGNPAGGPARQDGYCEECGARLPGEWDHVEADVDGVGGVSDKGLRHPRNEDAMAVRRLGTGVAAVVCDGVSSSPRPDEAAHAATERAVAVLAERIGAGDDPGDATLAAMRGAAERVTALAESQFHAPACTYVSAFVGMDAVTVGWLGDSRAYWLPAGTGGEGETGATALTEDDSWAGRMVTWGVMTEAEAQADPKAHVLVGWLGADASDTEFHVRTFAPGGPGAVVVCSDGLWNYLPEAETLHAAAPGARTDPRGTAAALVRRALDAGGHDNVTVVVVPFPPAAQRNRERQG